MSRADQSLNYDIEKYCASEYSDGTDSYELSVWMRDAWQVAETYESWADARCAAQVMAKKGYSVKLVDNDGRKVWEAL